MMGVVDKVNPVMLKELRQMVRNRSVVFSIIAFLAVLFIASAICLTVVVGGEKMANLNAASYASSNTGGVALYSVVSGITGLLISLIIPFMIMNRVALEFRKENVDLQYTTLLPPRAFVDGKAMCGVLLSASIALGALPFLMLAYLLRGIDMKTIALGTGGSILSSVLFCYIAVCVGIARINVILKRIFFIFFAYNMVGSLITIIGFMVSAGGSSHGGGPTAIFVASSASATGVALSFLIYICLIFLLRANAVMLMTPANFNRNRPVKLTWLVVWVATLAFTAFKCVDEPSFLFIWGGVIFLLMWCFQFLPYASGVNLYSRRVRSEISPNKFRRFFQYLFFDGGEGGVCFCLLMFVLTYLALLPGLPLSPGSGKLDAGQFTEGLLGFAAIAGYLISVPLVVRALCLSIPKLAKPKLIFALSIVVLVLLTTVPMLLSIPQFSAGEEEKALFKTLGNIPGVIYGLGKNTTILLWHFVAAMVLLLLGFALTIPNMLKSAKAFVPLAGTTGQHERLI